MTGHDRLRSREARHLRPRSLDEATLERVPSCATARKNALRGASVGSGPLRATFAAMDMHGVAEPAALGIAAGGLVYDKLPQARERTAATSGEMFAMSPSTDATRRLRCAR